MTPGRPRSDQVLLSFREASGKRDDADLDHQCVARHLNERSPAWQGSRLRVQRWALVDQTMAPTPWRGRQIASRDRAVKPTDAVQTSIAKKGTLT